MHGQILLGTLCHFRITLNHQMIDLIPAVPGKPLKKPHDLLLLLSNSKPLCFCVGTSGEQPCGSTGKSEVSWRNRKIPFHLHYSRLASSFLHSWKQHYVKGNSISVTLEKAWCQKGPYTPVWDLFIWKQYSDSGTKIMTFENNCAQGLSALLQRPFLWLNWMFFNF